MSPQPDRETKSNTHLLAQEIFRQLPTKLQAIYLHRLKETADKQARVPAVQAIAD